MKLVWPSREYLASYVAALERGWSPDNLRQAAAQEELARIASDADAFLASLVDREAAGDPIALPDGRTVPRLPGYRRWLWDGEFCGSIGFRWQRATEALPPHCLGHIGYAVVPWKQRRGYATMALREVLREARAEGLRFVEITTDPDNVASRRVIESNGGVLVEEFVTPIALGSKRELRYRVTILDGASQNSIVRTFRAIERGDYTQVRELLANMGWQQRVEDEARFERMIRGANRTVVAVENGRVVGFGRALFDGASNGYISTVAVAADRRGQGIGRELVGRLMDVDHPANITWVLRAGRDSPGFWEKMGFRKSEVAMEIVRKS
jgi:predicted acetyltransferase/N-acetylglutamate synthase-like GNAT family acetyltransferase